MRVRRQHKAPTALTSLTENPVSGVYRLKFQRRPAKRPAKLPILLFIELEKRVDCGSSEEVRRTSLVGFCGPAITQGNVRSCPSFTGPFLYYFASATPAAAAASVRRFIKFL